MVGTFATSTKTEGTCFKKEKLNHLRTVQIPVPLSQHGKLCSTAEERKLCGQGTGFMFRVK